MAPAGIDLNKFRGVQGCPFQGPFYQLMRQTLVAGYLRTRGTQAQVVSTRFAGNTSLHSLPEHLRALDADNMIEAWNQALDDDSPRLLAITVEQLMGAVDRVGTQVNEWRKYLFGRYGV